MSAFFFAISFENISYSRWVIHVAQAVFCIGATYWGIWLLLKKKSIGLPLALIFSLAAIHFEFFNIYLLGFVAIAIFYALFKLKIKFPLRDLFLSSFSLLLLLPFVLKEIKYDFRTVQGLLNFFTQHAGESIFSKLLNLPMKFFTKFSEVFFYNIFGIDSTLAKILTLIFFFLIILSIRNQKKFRAEKIFLLLWILSINIIYLLESFNAYFVSVGLTFPLIMLFSFVSWEIIQKTSPKILGYITLMVIIFIGNLFLIYKFHSQGDYLFSIQKKNVLSDKYALIDYIYQDAQGQPFKVNTVTTPLFINSVWAFVFNYYAKPKYGYMPQWAGYPQDGERVYGKEVQFTKYEETTKLFYFVIEPPEGIPAEYLIAHQKFENTRSKLLEEKKFGTHIVQKRQLFNSKIFLRDEVFQYSLEK